MNWPWIKKPINKVITIAAAVMLVIAIGGVIWGVTRHKEAGLIQACWEGDIAVLEKGNVQECNPNNLAEIRWEKSNIPLVVTPLDHSGQELSKNSEGYIAVERAIRNINLQWGYTHYTLGTADTDIKLLWGAAYTPGQKNAPGYSKFFGSNGMTTHAIVGIRDTSSSRLTHRILLHELGHASGLDHDSFKASIMFPLIEDDTMEDMVMDRFTDHDVELLRELYNE